MNIERILTELRSEHAQLEEAILALERLGGQARRRGRPPKWLVAAKDAPAGARKRGRPRKDAQRP